MAVRHAIAFRTAAVLLGVALPLAISEGVSAWLIARDKARWKAELPDAVRATVNLDDRHIPTEPDPYLGYRVRPNLAGARVQTDDYGLREGPIDRQPAPGVVRILFLGGSVAWGYLANSNEDTVPSYLEAELARRGRRVEVLNAGVPGYVSWQEALSYALYLRELSPDWIITLDGTNDIVSAIINGRAGVPALYRSTERAYLGGPNPLQALGGWLLEGAKELRTVKAFERLRPKPLSAYGPPPPAEIGAQLRAATAYLDHAAQREGARVFTVLQPLAVLPGTKPLTEFERRVVAEQEHRMPGRNAYYAESYAAMRAALAELARERAGALLWLDATDAFADTTEPAYTDDCHLTPLGQRRLAERIADGWIAAQRAD